MTVLGIDVHGAKGAINWRSVKASGRSFAFIKATEGETFTDGRFATNRRDAKAAGLLVGAYHFARPDLHHGAAGAQDEARHFLAVAKPVRGELRPVLDYEVSPDPSWALSWLRYVEKETGKKPIIYGSSSFLATMMARATDGQRSALRQYPLWVANYGVNDGRMHTLSSPGYGLSPAIHQFTSVGRVPGVPGDCDQNRRLTTTWTPLLFSPTVSGYALEVIAGGKIVKHIVYGGGRVTAYLKSTAFARLVGRTSVRLLRHKRGQ